MQKGKRWEEMKIDAYIVGLELMLDKLKQELEAKEREVLELKGEILRLKAERGE